jgi:hypothetical protein
MELARRQLELRLSRTPQPGARRSVQVLPGGGTGVAGGLVGKRPFRCGGA